MSGKISFQLQDTKSGHLTCKAIIDSKQLLLHSAYDPKKEAKRFISTHLEEIKKSSKILVYGLGCAYHVREIIEQTMDSRQIIEVWELNNGLYKFIKERTNLLADLLDNQRVTIHVHDDEGIILNKWMEYDNSYYLIIHEPSFKLMPDHLSSLKEILGSYLINSKTMLANKAILENNFNINVKHGKLAYGTLLKSMPNIPMVLAAAGPSLEKVINHLQQHRDRFFFGAVGTALRPLINHEIAPDFIMLTDPSEQLLEQFAGVDREVLKNIPLFYLGTISPLVVSAYPGPKIMLLQKGFAEAEMVALSKNLPLVETGGSVATTTLDWLVKLGAKQICFVGQDLAFTNDQSHATGTHNHRAIANIETSHQVYVSNYHQRGRILTSANLATYKRWIEGYIRRNNDITFYNATQGGAFIEGCKNITLSEFVELTFSNINIDDFRKKFLNKINTVIDNYGC